MLPHGDVALIDGDVLIYSVGFGSEDVSLAFACSRLSRTVDDLVYKDAGCKRYEGFLTVSGPTYRHEVAVTAVYKGTRSSPRPKHYEGLRKYAEEVLGFVKLPNCEADDAVGIRNAELRAQGQVPVMIHVDKDLDMLPGVHMNTKTREWFEVTPQQGMITFYRQVITGDRTDNIVGADKVGPVTAAKIILDDMEEEMCYVLAVVCLGSEERVLENARLCWMQTKEGELWVSPFDRQEAAWVS